MKVKFPESFGEEILYERSLNFNKLDDENLSLLLQGLETGLDIECEKLRENKYTVVEYEIIFYKGKLKDWETIGSSMIGGFNLSDSILKEDKEYLLDDFQGKYKNLFKEVKEEYRRSPRDFNLKALVIGFRDAITNKIEAFNPYNN